MPFKPFFEQLNSFENLNVNQIHAGLRISQALVEPKAWRFCKFHIIKCVVELSEYQNAAISSVERLLCCQRHASAHKSAKSRRARQVGWLFEFLSSHRISIDKYAAKA